MDATRRKGSNRNVESVGMISVTWEGKKMMDQSNNHIYPFESRFMTSIGCDLDVVPRRKPGPGE